MKFKKLLLLWMAFILAGCGAFKPGTPQALPTIVLGSDQNGSQSATQAAPQVASGGVTASGVVVPIQQAQLAFAMGGIVQAVNVAAGDAVQAGQVLATLAGGEQLQAALSAAELNVLTSQQALVDLQKPQPLNIAQAQVALDNAKTALDDLLNPPGATLYLAQKAVLDAQDALDTAQKFVDGLQYGRASESQIAAAQAAYVVAQSEVDRLQQIYDHTQGDPAQDASKALALSNLETAGTKRDRALANLNWMKGVPTQLEVDQKNNDLALAKAQLAQAQSDLDRLTNPSQVDVALAQATLDDAQQALDKLLAGPDPEQLALLQVRLKSAQDAADAAKASLNNLELKAPFAGTVGRLSIHSGEWATPGQPVLVLLDLSRFQVDTTDLSERDISQVQVGQKVTVFIKALNQEVSGSVIAISPLADTLGGDVVYQTTIELDTIPVGLKAGMSAEVRYGGG